MTSGDLLASVHLLTQNLSLFRNVCLQTAVRHDKHEISVSAYFAKEQECLWLQASAVMGDLQCFFTKHPMAEACLGLPLRYTMNPKTQQLDYIEAGLDLVSLDAVHSGWVAKSPDGQDIQACLPLYLTYEHFERVKVKPLLGPASTVSLDIHTSLLHNAKPIRL